MLVQADSFQNFFGMVDTNGVHTLCGVEQFSAEVSNAMMNLVFELINDIVNNQMFVGVGKEEISDSLHLCSLVVH